MWTTIIILGVVAIIGFLLLNSKEEGEQAVGAYTLGAFLPALIKLSIFIGIIVLIVRACS